MNEKRPEIRGFSGSGAAGVPAVWPGVFPANSRCFPGTFPGTFAGDCTFSAPFHDVSATTSRSRRDEIARTSFVHPLKEPRKEFVVP
jgi:hypothetical protein